jgi:hypothetical protein
VTTVSVPPSDEGPLDLRPLAHPLWWVAVAVLFVNDNYLKGGGLAPGWLTGKLSDFAFLIVAPVLLGCLLPARLRWRRQIALAAVAGLYVATELSPAAADAVVAVAARLGMHWRLWPDLTDLLAVVVLPLSWRLLDRPWLRARPLRPLGVIIGLHLCLATTDNKGMMYPFLVNRSSGKVQMRLTRLQADACQVDLKGFAATLSLGDLGASEDFGLARGEVAALNAPALEGKSSARICYDYQTPGPTPPCTVVLVEAVGGPAVLVRSPLDWYTHGDGSFVCGAPPESSHCRQPHMDPNGDPGPGALSLVGGPGALNFQAAPELETVPVSRAEIDARGVAPESCQGLEAQLATFLASAGACGSDADCQPARLPSNLSAPARPCFVYTNGAGATLLDTLARQSIGRCPSLIPPVCEDLPPGACRAGRCEAACPGQACAHRCRPGENELLDCKTEGDLCAMDDSRWCRCQDKLWRCGPPATVTTCAVTCVGFTTDGGTPADAGPDATTD